MKLFVWHNVLTDYTDGVMFALANSLDEAREAISPGWAKTEAQLAASGCDEPYPGLVHKDLRVEPEEYDSAVGFAVWGGG